MTPSTSPSAGKSDEFFPEPQSVVGRAASRMTGSLRLSGSGGRNSTPLGIRARLSSLGANSPRPKRASSSSTLTLQAPGPGLRAALPLRPPTPSSSEGSDSEDEELAREEEAERQNEERAEWDKHLKDLQRRMTSDALGLVSTGLKGNRGRMADRSRFSMGNTNTYSHRSESQSLSSAASSRNGSIPDIPSPPSDSQPQSPVGRRISSTKSSSPPALSPRSAHSHRRIDHIVARSASENSSSQGSQASSFSDIGSGKTTLFSSGHCINTLIFSRCKSICLRVGECSHVQHPGHGFAFVSFVRALGYCRSRRSNFRSSAFTRSRLNRGSGVPH